MKLWSELHADAPVQLQFQLSPVIRIAHDCSTMTKGRGHLGPDYRARIKSYDVGVLKKGAHAPVPFATRVYVRIIARQHVPADGSIIDAYLPNGLGICRGAAHSPTVRVKRSKSLLDVR